MSEIVGVDHIAIRVSNLATARQFYEQLGFVFIEGPSGPEPIAILKHPCGIVINFILNASGSPEANVLMDVAEKYAGYTHVAFHVEDLLSMQEKLNDLNINITEGPVDFGGNYGASLFIRDQDRNVIEFHQSASLGE